MLIFVFLLTLTGLTCGVIGFLYIFERDLRILQRSIDLDMFDDGSYESVPVVSAQRLRAETLLALLFFLSLIPYTGWLATRDSLRSLMLVAKNANELRDNTILAMYMVLCAAYCLIVIVVGAFTVAVINAGVSDAEKALRYSMGIAESTLMQNFFNVGFATMSIMPILNVFLWELFAVVKRNANSQAAMFDRNAMSSAESESDDEASQQVQASVQLPLLPMRRRL